ncbi:MAG: membrane protein insertion efficiency factor YidD [Bacteroidota bacterium]
MLQKQLIRKCNNTLKKALEYGVLAVIRFYQLGISPYFPPSCRHQPTCSQYMIDAVNEWGLGKGFILGIKRLSKCHPWGTHGYDPVPGKKI